MATFKVNFVNIDVKNFVDGSTGEIIEHFQLNVDGDVPCKKLSSDGTYVDSTANSITKRSSVIKAMLQSASSDLADVRRLRGKTFDAVSLNALLAGAQLEIEAELVKANSVVDGYIYKNDGYRYKVVSVTLDKAIATEIADSKKAALRKALGL